jgi:hypothetical protein
MVQIFFSGGGTFCPTPRFARMSLYSVPFPRTRSLAIAAATVVVAFTVSVTAAQRPQGPVEYPPQPQAEQGRTAAQLIYPDAPDGVDPVTTGPVSQEFRKRQRAARCEEAVWPNIPVTCYP